MINYAYPDIQEGENVVLDTETNGLDWQTCHTVGFVVTLPDRGLNYYYPIRHETGHNLDPAKVIAWIKSWSGKRFKLIGHNLKFDLHFCANDGIYFPNVTMEDTQINATLIDENLKGGYSMDNVGKVYGVTQKKATFIYEYLASKFGGIPDKKQMANFWRLDAEDPAAHEYAMGDGTTTWQIYKLQSEIIPYQGLERVHAVECKLIYVLFKMERRGVPVSQQNLDSLKVYIDRRLEAAQKLLPTSFNPRSSNQVADVLSNEEGLSRDEFPRTPLGNLSFVEDFLKLYPTGRAIINVRKLTNLQNSFIKGSVEDKLYRGRIHCNFNQMFDGDYGTHTGRLSSNGPNMQQVPKRDKTLAPIFRRIFVPETGCVWDTNDYSQQEYRIFAAYSNSATLIDNYRRGIDMHQTIADLINRERDPYGKRLNLAMLYWMGKDKVAASLGISVKEAINILDQYNESVPEVVQFRNRCQATAKEKGYVTTIMGRRRRYPDSGKAYQGASGAIQGTCADIVKKKMVEVNDLLESETRCEHGLILQCHDSLDWFLPPELRALADEATRIMGDMSTISPLLAGKVPMVVDSASGPTWGHASFPKQDWKVYEEEISGDELSVEIED